MSPRKKSSQEPRQVRDVFKLCVNPVYWPDWWEAFCGHSAATDKSNKVGSNQEESTKIFSKDCLRTSCRGNVEIDRESSLSSNFSRDR